MTTGKVKYWNQDRGFGFITAEDDEEVFVHFSALIVPGCKSLKQGQRVKFKRVQGHRGTQARCVELLPSDSVLPDRARDTSSPSKKVSTVSVSDNTIQPYSTNTPSTEIDAPLTDPDMESEDIEELDSTNVDRQLLMEISRWKREAKAEDNDRYFWHVREVEQITRGEKYFVIGRKGSGKTAICEYLNRLRRHDVFAEQLSFKNFPFNELYGHKNQKYTPPNQFISIWKYLIYSTVCRLMLRNESVDSALREQLSQLYNDNVPLSRRIGQWVGHEFGVSLFGLSIKLSKRLSTATPQNWIDHVDFLEDLVSQHAGTATYYILFDALDEDYRDLVEKDQYLQYTALVTSLFKAVQDVRTTLGLSAGIRVYPVIFLRDDIYELVQDSDKNKWGDFRVDLNWDIEKIKKVLAFRISRALDANCTDILSFDAAWHRIFGARQIGVGTKGKTKVSTFEYITRSTFLRPRDFVSYLQNCAQHAVDEGVIISPEVVKRVDKAFSNYLRDELTDELFAILPDISNIFNAISHLRKWNFSIREFQKAYSEQVEQGFIKQRDVKFVLQVLFLFSVIGNSPRVGRYFFRYQNREARLNFNERIVVHRGLFKSLQIL